MTEVRPEDGRYPARVSTGPKLLVMASAAVCLAGALAAEWNPGSSIQVLIGGRAFVAVGWACLVPAGLAPDVALLQEIKSVDENFPSEVFEELGVLDRLEAFASFNGADFYGLPRNGDTVTLRREPWTVPADYPLGDGRVVPLRAGETVAWRVLG